MSTGAVIYIIDSDAKRRTARRDEVAGKSWDCVAFESVSEFLDEHHGNQRGCVVLAVGPEQQGDISDMGLVAALQARGDDLPVIMLINESQAYGIAKAIRGGAYECLAHDAPAADLREVVALAIDEYDLRHQARSIMLQLDEQMEQMTHQQRLLVSWLRANLSPHDISLLMRGSSHNRNGKHNGHGNHNGNGSRPLEVERWLGFATEQIGSLSPRVRQTLDLLLSGFSEKQIAVKLNISRHTVHGYVKTLHNKLDVSSRGELLAKCLGTYQTEIQFEESAAS